MSQVGAVCVHPGHIFCCQDIIFGAFLKNSQRVVNYSAVAVYVQCVAVLHPVALVKTQKTNVNGKPIVDVCCIDEGIISTLDVDPRIWRDFKMKYKTVPLFHRKSVISKMDICVRS